MPERQSESNQAGVPALWLGIERQSAGGPLGAHLGLRLQSLFLNVKEPGKLSGSIAGNRYPVIAFSCLGSSSFLKLFTYTVYIRNGKKNVLVASVVDVGQLGEMPRLTSKRLRGMTEVCQRWKECQQ